MKNSDQIKASITKSGLNKQFSRETIEKYGFMSSQPPAKSMSAAYHVWDEYLEQLPTLVANKTIATALEKMPILDAEPLREEELSRAAMIFTYLAHAYAFEERKRLDKKIIDFPECIQTPWSTIAKRLNLRAPVGTIYDVSLFNWQLKNEAQAQQYLEEPESITLNDMEPLAKWFGTDTEKYFHLTITAMEIAVIPVVRSISQILTAIEQQDNEAIIERLQTIITAIHKITHTFKSLHLNSMHQTHVDSVLWSNSVAKFTEAIREGMPGISGLGSPFFLMMDAFIERVKYDSDLGGLAKAEFFMLRPEHQKFVNCITQSPLSAYLDSLEETNPSKAMIQTLMDQIMLSYLGKTGLLPVHITKVSGYLTGMQFTTRHVTNAGHEVGEDHKIARMKQKFMESIEERKRETSAAFRYVSVKKTLVKTAQNGTISHVKIQLNQPMFIFTGAVCKFAPQQNQQLIETILTQLQLNGDMPILLEDNWVKYFSKRGYTNFADNKHYVKLADVLKYTHFTANTYQILQEIFLRPEQSEEVVSNLLSKKLRLLRSRYYSIAEHNGTSTTLATEIGFFIKSEPFGIASQQMAHLETNEVLVKIVPMPHAEYPLYQSSKKVIFAGGTGIATYLQYFDEPSTSTTVFMSVRTQDELALYQPVLTKLKHLNKLDVHIVCTRDQCFIRSPMGSAHFNSPEPYYGNLLTYVQDQAMMLEVIQMLQPNSHTAAMHVCISGSTSFATAILNHFRFALAQASPELNIEQHMNHLLVNERIMVSALSQQEPIDNVFNMTEVVVHNNALQGNWVAVENGVYDLTRYIPIHPGGQLVLRQLSGMDISDKLNFFHGKNNQIYSMLEQYRIGQLRGSHCPLNELLSLCAKAENDLVLTQEYQTFDLNLVRIERAKNVLFEAIKKILALYPQSHFFQTLQKNSDFACFIEEYAQCQDEQLTRDWSTNLLRLFKETFSVIKYYIRMFQEKTIEVNFLDLLNKLEKKYHEMALLTAEYFDVHYNSMVIVGAGLGGVAAAIALKQQGCDVHIYEKYNDPRYEAGETGGVSFNITLSERGLQVLEALGLRKSAEKMSEKATARRIYREMDIVEQMYGPKSEALYSIKRLNLLTLLLDKAEAIGVNFHFNCELKDYDFSKEQVRFNVFQKRKNKHFSVQSSRLIGADGARSSVRNALEDYLKQPRTVIHENDFVYRELCLPASIQHKFDASRLHIWPKGQFMMMAFPNHDGSFALTLFVNKHYPEMEKLKNDRLFFIEFIRHHFPQIALQVVPLLWTEHQKKWNTLLQIDCQQWHIEDKVLLIGDAAHAFYPFLGQAANCAMEDGFKLAQLFKQGLAWKIIFEQMQQRKKDTDAIAQLVLSHQTSLGAEPSDEDMQRFELGLEVTKKAPFRKSTHANISFTSLGYDESIRKGKRHAFTVNMAEKMLASNAKSGISKEHVIIKAISHVSYLSLFAKKCKKQTSDIPKSMTTLPSETTCTDLTAQKNKSAVHSSQSSNGKCPFHFG